MNTLRIVPCAAAALALFASSAALAQQTPPKNLEFTITKGTTPDGKAEYTGTVKFSRESVKDVFKVTWKLSDGSTYSGHGVASGDYMAVAYGSEAIGVAMYQLKDKTIAGTWAPAKDGAKLSTYGLKRGKEKHQYVYNDDTPGLITIEPSEVTDVANISYEMPDRKFGGIGLVDGDYMAVGGATGVKDFGVVIYHMNKDMTASGKWIVAGAFTPGTEELKLVTLDGKAVLADGAAPATEKGAKGGKEMSDKELAEAIAVDLKKCAAAGEYFVDQMKSDDMEAVVGLVDDKAFNEKVTRETFATAIAGGRKELGKMTAFSPDKKKTDFKAINGGDMLFTLEGDGTYENAKTREVLRFLKAKGTDKVVIVGYTRTVQK
jgi:hypothetical protein